MYFRLDQKFTGTTGMTSIQPKPNCTARPVPAPTSSKDQDTRCERPRQRNF